MRPLVKRDVSSGRIRAVFRRVADEGAGFPRIVLETEGQPTGMSLNVLPHPVDRVRADGARRTHPRLHRELRARDLHVGRDGNLCEMRAERPPLDERRQTRGLGDFRVERCVLHELVLRRHHEVEAVRPVTRDAVVRVRERHIGKKILLVAAQAARVVGGDLLVRALHRPHAQVRNAALEHAVVDGVFGVPKSGMLVADRLRPFYRRGTERPAFYCVRLGHERAVHVETNGRGLAHHRHVRPLVEGDHAGAPRRLRPVARLGVERAETAVVDEEDEATGVRTFHIRVDPVAEVVRRRDVRGGLHPRLHGEARHARRERLMRGLHAVRYERRRRPVGVLQHDRALHGHCRKHGNRQKFHLWKSHFHLKSPLSSLLLLRQ